MLTETVTIDESHLGVTSRIRGACEVCGADTGDGRRSRCDEHPKTAKSKSVRQRVTSAKPSADKTTGTFAKLFVIISLILMYGRVRKLQIPDPSGALAEELALTEGEAIEIARPISRFTLSTEAGVRVVKPLVDNEDVIGALFALYEYNRRTTQLLERFAKGEVVGNMRRKGGDNTHVDSGPVAEGGQLNGSIIVGGNPWDFD
jgi:hypothetical protein